MKFTAAIFVSAVAFLGASAAPYHQARSISARDVNPAQVLQFGVAQGVRDPNGSASCVGINNILIPCSCPPDRTAFINSLNANVNAGHAVNNPGVPVSFPSDNSVGSQIARVQAQLITLQNLNGPGVGCPAVSTTFSAALKALTG
ncbi:hypothetical protein DL93DRAFT_2100228 [Clavulina sp. PMI_390]|nr:hypothetical protein DL93DRAFT_2100228 [Clavulina sp. PMI_390]